MSTSRERFIKTLNHEQPDKVVADMGSTAITGIHSHALSRLRTALGLEERKVKIHEPLQLLGYVEEDVREALGLDIVDVANQCNLFGFPNENWKPWTLQTKTEVLVPEGFQTTVDESGRTYLYPQGDLNMQPSGMMPKGGYFFDIIVRGNQADFEEEDRDARRDFQYDFSVLGDKVLRQIEDRTDHYYNQTGYGLICGIGLSSFGDFAAIPGAGVKEPKGVRDLVDFMMAHKICPEYIHELFDMQLEIALQNAELLKQACGNKIQAIYVSGTDFGTQNGPFMSLESYREFYKPYHIKINQWIHENTEWKSFFHSCGAVSSYLQDFYEAGMDILNPVQLSAKGMDGKMLKEKWGDKFVFWGGGVDTQKTLPFGTPEEVYEEVMERLELFAEGGGYVFNTVHNIQGPTAPENIIAMFRAVRDFNNKDH